MPKPDSNAHFGWETYSFLCFSALAYQKNALIHVIAIETSNSLFGGPRDEIRFLNSLYKKYIQTNSIDNEGEEEEGGKRDMARELISILNIIIKNRCVWMMVTVFFICV